VRVEDELSRARRVFETATDDPAMAALYAPFRPATLFTVQEREWLLAGMLRRAGLNSLADLDILDVGCGAGGELRRMTVMGAEPSRLAGIDLVEGRVAAARRALPEARIEVGSAHELPFADASFDLVSQFVVFSSIVDPALRRAIAGEMARVLRPAGMVLWYDVHRARATSDFVPIGLAEMRDLFADFSIRARSTTLRWRLNQRLIWRSRSAGLVLERIPFLCDHYLAVLERKSAPGT
jgi:SAM-dependent methyltransferase